MVLFGIIFNIQPILAGESIKEVKLNDSKSSFNGNINQTQEFESNDVSTSAVKRANFKSESVSKEAREIGDWIVDSGNNQLLPFIIIDKENTKAFAFDADGNLIGAAPVLLGLAKGDDSLPGIGHMKLSAIKPENRTTPAGRFMAKLDKSIHGKEILWVDYDTAISLHRVVTSNPKEHRAERLASPTTLDNRISFGCINVPIPFYEEIVSPSFREKNGVVYILPETRSALITFGAYNVDEHLALQSKKSSLLTKNTTE